jgi:hypothetical protein
MDRRNILHLAMAEKIVILNSLFVIAKNKITKQFRKTPKLTALSCKAHAPSSVIARSAKRNEAIQICEAL